MEDITIDVGEKITTLLEQLANQIGVTVEQVFPWLVRQQFLEAICNIIIYIFLLISLPIITYKAYNKTEEWEAPTIPGMICIISLIAFSVVYMLCLVDMSNNITQIFNPEYHALKNLMEMVK